MTNTGKKQNRKNSLKNVKAQLKRRNDKIARLEATIVQLKESQKKTPVQTMDKNLQAIAETFQDTNTQSLSSDLPSRSDAKQTAALEILLRLLKN